MARGRRMTTAVMTTDIRAGRGGTFLSRAAAGSSVAATAVITFTDSPVEDQTLTVGDKTATFKSIVTFPQTEIEIGGDVETTVANTAAFINARTLETLCTAIDAGGGVVNLTANEPGTAGNSIALSTTSNRIEVTPFSGGED
jgi:hypothetical protein